MDYKKLISAVKLCGSTPKVEQGKSCVYWAGSDMSKCIPRMTADAAAAITDLLPRAEKAERERDAIKSKLKYFLDTTEEDGVVYVPKFIVEKCIYGQKEK